MRRRCRAIAPAARFFAAATAHPRVPIRRAAALIRSKGDQQLTVEELTSEIQPHGRATVPDEVKADLLQRIRRFVEEQGA